MPEVPAQHPDDVANYPPSDRAAEALLERLRVATRGEYDVFGELGRGGMATVYLAHEISLNRKVAIKVMSPGMVHGPGMVERFKRESRTAAGLSHPNIIPIYAVREVDDLLFCVIKLVQGTPLDAIIRELVQLPIPMVQAILAQVGDALSYAHRQGVVHRDVKPGNILIDNEGWAVVTDFGIAKVQESESLTMTGVAVGTPAYMSPEQCGGDEVTGASDQYSLGVVAYEMLAGRTPFTGSSLMGLMFNHFHDEPPALENFRPDCPAPMRDAVMRMLRKKPDERWPSMEEATIAMGARPLAHDDPTRGQLITLAKTGVTHRIVSQVQTPRSPIPLTRKPEANTPPPAPLGASSASAPNVSAGVVPTVIESAPALARQRPIVLGSAAVALLAVGYLIARLAAPGAPAAPLAPSASPPVASGSGAEPVARAPAIPPTGATTASSPAATPPAPAPSKGSERSAASPSATALPPSSTPSSTLGRSVTASVSRPPEHAPALAEEGATKPAPAPPESSVSVPLVSSSSVRAQSPNTPPPAPAPSATVVAPPTPDVQGEVRSLILSFGSSLAAGDLAAARRLYPGMPTDQREGLEALWKDGGTMTPRWTVSGITVDGNVASARVQGINVVTSRRGQPSQVPVSLRARLERRGTEWRLVSLVN